MAYYIGAIWIGWLVIQVLVYTGIWADVVPSMRPVLVLVVGVGLGMFARYAQERKSLEERKNDGRYT